MIRLRFCVGLMGCAAWAATEAQSSPDSDQGVRRDKTSVPEAARREWQIQEKDVAVETARKLLDLGPASERISASLETLSADATPFLSKDILNRPLWHITVLGWSIRSLPSLPGLRDRFSRTLDVWLDPATGVPVKLETRWPDGEPTLKPRRSADAAAAWMLQFGKETYHAFPDVPPKMSVEEALRIIIQQGGANPMNARQIIANYVVWSNEPFGRRVVWVITFRGVPPDDPARAGTKEPRFVERYIVDIEKRRWLFEINGP